MPAPCDALTRLIRTVSRRRAPGLVSALLLVAGAAVAEEPLPPLPKLPLDTYAADVRGSIAKAHADAQGHPRDPARNGALGMLLYANEQYEPAEACFVRAQALDAAEARWPYYLAKTLSNLSRHDRAAAAAQEALRRRPGYLPGRLLLAKSLLDAGKVEESRGLYEALVREHPEAAEAHYGLGRIDARRDEHSSAAEHLRRACDLFPTFGAAHFALARAYRDLGEKEKAQEELVLYQKDKLGWPAVPDPFLAALVTLKTGAGARLQKGIQLAEVGQLEAAADEHEAALLADPTLLPAHINLIRLYGSLGRPEKAEEHYRAAVAHDPNLAEIHYNHGVLLGGQGKSAEAMEALRRALELKPDYAEAHNNYAYLLMTSGKLDEAAQHYRAAIEGRPDFRAAHFNLGRILVAQGRVVEAIDHLQKTLAPEDEETPRCAYALGAAYARVGNRAVALTYMQEAQEKASARGQTDLVNSIERDLRRLTGTTSPP
ncbi:MAG TPA: tetratricopeptide repeat protein [Vicinamibacteria bacterium]|nr:tetratricopeptide repeat protein [Vicinamibacteria bacterium]